MAKGFESKQVEDQQAEAERRRELRDRDANVTGAAASSRRKSLELARTDAQRRMETAADDRMRTLLKRNLEAIQAELAKPE